MQEIFEREQEIRKRMEDAGRHILFNARNELFLHMRFLDVALSSFSYAMDAVSYTHLTLPTNSRV